MAQTTEETKKSTTKKFFTGVGRRKTASAQVRLHPGKGKFILNDKELENIDDRIKNPLTLTGQLGKFDVTIVVKGGGFMSQTDSIILGLARALVEFDETLKPTLRKAGLITRDPREKERKKPGLKRARRAPQFSKR